MTAFSDDIKGILNISSSKLFESFIDELFISTKYMVVGIFIFPNLDTSYSNRYDKGLKELFIMYTSSEDFNNVLSSKLDKDSW